MSNYSNSQQIPGEMRDKSEDKRDVTAGSSGLFGTVWVQTRAQAFLIVLGFIDLRAYIHGPDRPIRHLRLRGAGLVRDGISRVFDRHGRHGVHGAELRANVGSVSDCWIRLFLRPTRHQ